ncbi:alpha/beta hydrolase [Sphingomonas hengshuiensis]|uniref:alpha/beta hydrolase n=1 Tax=Sphingomonas hengshuiensis TaxID=1609977 RepID=UPI001D11D556|nr:alpha/beta hydrolase [Sphingomonas hengshuiensis]
MQPALGPLPEAWRAAEVIPLWTGAMPESGFKAHPVPADSPGTFLRNIETPAMRLFRPARPNGAAVLVIPGGAYDFISILNEGVSVAENLTAKGYTVFVLTYRLPGEGWSHRADVPLQDAQRALRTIRAKAADFGLQQGRFAVLGFSAGGHLAATLATDFGQEVYTARDATDRLDARPDAVGLIYPVITAKPPFTHGLSAERLLGTRPTPEAIARRSPADRVTTATPPTFLVHSLDDGAVPVENSLLMLEALRAAKRPVEAHFFEEGGHGYGLGAPEASTGHWIDSFDLWLQRVFATPPAPVSDRD